MRAAPFALAALCLIPVPAQAHRLDEYLQATTISISSATIAMRLRLTPGVSFADALLAGIDADGDGRFSSREQLEYAARVGRDLSLTVDGRPAPLRLVSRAFPREEALRTGGADILLDFDAPLPGRKAIHRLVFSNRHYRGSAVYLVNARAPRDPGTGITGQERAIDQSVYILDFETRSAAPGPAARAADRGAAAWPLIVTFVRHGVRHILTGYDHLLFGLALALGATSIPDLLGVVTVFTIAHSLTLTLTALGLLAVPGAIVEPVIAASIVVVALQNVVRPSSARGPTRLVAAFLFGLFHGLGFAGGLLGLMHAMPAGMVLLAILGFSIGIEAGNQLVLLPSFALLTALRRARGKDQRLARGLRRSGSALISLAGMYYLGMDLATA